MTKSAVTDWSTTAASNTDVGGIGIEGSNTISNFDNAVREVMAQIATFITGASFTGNFTVTSTDAGASVGPTLKLYRNSASPAASDIIARLDFAGMDSGAAEQRYGDIYVQITDPTAASEDATMFIRNVVAGTVTSQISLTATGAQIPAIGATTPGTGAFTTLSATGTASLVAANLTGNLSISKVTPAITLTSTGTGSDSTIIEHTSGLTYAADVNNEVASSFHIFTVDGTQKFAVGASAVGVSAGVSLVASAGGSLTGTWTDLGTVSTVVINGGTITGITDLAVADGGTGASTAANARTNLGLAIGTDVQAYDSGLAALAAFNTNGILCQTANNTFSGRMLTGTTAEITVTNGDGVSGNPTLSLPTALTFTGKTVTGGTFNATAFNGPIGGTTPAAGAFTTVAASSTLTAFDSITLTSTDAGATDAPLLILDRNSASPANGDRLGSIQIKGRDSGGNTHTYADFLFIVTDKTDGSEDANITIRNSVAGSLTTQSTITATGWNSMNIGATTPGTGAFTTLNANGGGALTGTWSNMGTVTTIDINGGTVDGATVGATTAGTGRFTVLTATTSVNLPVYTVAGLPAAGTAGRMAYASNLRVFNGAGTQEGVGAGTGGVVHDNGTAWKIAGTNVTAVA